jgi:hypothetical protein
MCMDERIAYLAVHQHSPTPAPRLTKQIPRKLGGSHVFFRQNIVPPPASPSTLLRTQSNVGNSIFNVFGAGIVVAARRDFGALSAASGLVPRAERMNSASHPALYAPMDDPCGSLRLFRRFRHGGRTWYSSETARCCGLSRLTARMRAVWPDLRTVGQPSCFPARLGTSAGRTREKSQRVRSTPARRAVSGMLGCFH